MLGARARAVALALICAAALAYPAGAAVAARAPRPAFSLTVSPGRTVVPAATRNAVHVIRVTNSGRRPLHLDTSVREFRQAENGEITFVRGGPLSAASWLTVEPRSFDLAPGDRRGVRVRVAVPADPEPGERQLAVIFRVPPPARPGRIAISGGVAAQLLVNVPGRVVRRVSLDRLDAPLVADADVTLRLRVANEGNVHRDFIVPQNLVARVDGRRVAFPSFTVLRESARTLEAVWTDPPLVCVCTARVTTDDGSGRPVTIEARVIVLPYRLGGGVLLAGTGLVLVLRALRRGQRAKRESEVRAARQEAYEQARRDVESGG